MKLKLPERVEDRYLITAENYSLDGLSEWKSSPWLVIGLVVLLFLLIRG